MANFIFNSASSGLQANTLDLSTGNYYAHIVTTVPILSNTTVANLTLPTITGYTSTPLTGLSYNANRWTFASFAFPKYLFSSIPTGVVICRRSGATPATTDSIICYSDFNNSIGQVLTLTVGNYLVNLAFGENGAINFLYRYQYSSGAFANIEPVPKGSLFLIGSKNNTATFANPFVAGQTLGTNGNGTSSILGTTDRVIDSLGFTFSRFAYNFGSRTIKVGEIRLFMAANSTSTVLLFGSNSLTIFDTANVSDNSKWTQIGSIVNPATNWQPIATTNQTYWQYVKFETSDLVNSMPVQQVEFYNSQVLSPTINFT